MIVAVDVGNTSTKVGFFSESKLIKKHTFIEKSKLSNFLSDVDYEGGIVSSVGNITQGMELANKYNLLFLTTNLKLPISLQYQSKNTLGNDRIANVVGAYDELKKSVLIIDAGTCITYDYVNKKGEYIGGGISPGLQMKYNALHTFTENLPLIKDMSETDLIGRNTQDSMKSGVINGTIYEIIGIISQYQRISPNFATVLTGGDGEFLMKFLPKSIILRKNLLLEGLEKIFRLNAINS